MAPSAVRCSHCGAECGIAAGQGDEGWRKLECPACRESIRVYAFPALFRPPLRKPRRQAAAEGEASCYFHPGRRATVPCDGCGRFLCSLCDLEFPGRHFCAACLGDARKGRTGSASGPGDLLREKVFLPHNLAWALACYAPLTLVGLYLIPVSAPAALWFALRHWNRRDGLQIRGRWRAFGAVILAFSQLAVTAGLGVLLAIGMREMIRQ